MKMTDQAAITTGVSLLTLGSGVGEGLSAVAQAAVAATVALAQSGMRYDAEGRSQGWGLKSKHGDMHGENALISAVVAAGTSYASGTGLGKQLAGKTGVTKAMFGDILSTALNVGVEYGKQQTWGKNKSNYEALTKPDAGRLGGLLGILAQDKINEALLEGVTALGDWAQQSNEHDRSRRAVDALLGAAVEAERRKKLLEEGEMLKGPDGRLYVKDPDGNIVPVPDQSNGGGGIGTVSDMVSLLGKITMGEIGDRERVIVPAGARKDDAVPGWMPEGDLVLKDGELFIKDNSGKLWPVRGNNWNGFGNDVVSDDAIDYLEKYKTTQRIFMHYPGFISAKSQQEVLDGAMGGAQNSERFLEQMFKYQRDYFGSGVKNSWRDWVVSGIDMITSLPIDAPMGEPIPAETLFAKDRKEEYQKWVQQLKALRNDPLAQAAFMIGSEKGEKLGEVAGAVSQMLAEAAVGNGLARVAKWARGPLPLKGGASSRGFAFEAEAKMRVELELGERTLDAQHHGRAGIDFLSIRGDGLNAELIINEVKHTDTKKYVPASKFTAINQNLETNLAFARESIQQARREGKISLQTAQTLINQIDNKTAKIRLIGREGHTMFSARTVQKLERITGMPIDHIFHIPGIKP